MNLPVNYYTQWYWKIDLHNLLHFLSLRMDDHAQYEIRVYGEVIGELVQKWVPTVWEAFMDFRVGGAFFSAKELEIIKKALDKDIVDQLLPESDLSMREKRAFRKTLDVPKT